MKITIEYEIPDDSIELLTRLQKEGYAEFRDGNLTLQEYLDFFTEDLEKHTERYHKRNFCELDKMLRLEAVGFVKANEDSWNLTYLITEKGLEFLNKNR